MNTEAKCPACILKARIGGYRGFQTFVDRVCTEDDRCQRRPPPALDGADIVERLRRTLEEMWKPEDRRRDLIRAAALLVAEIERLDRATPPTNGGPR
jgi:hypothetical protein